MITLKKSKNILRFINFDESNLPLDMAGDSTIDKIGTPQVKILTHSKERETCSIATGISSNGEVILPLVIFKYKYKGTKDVKRTCP